MARLKGENVVIGQIGLGSWGPNLLRNFAGLEDCKVKTCCDLDQNNLKKAKKNYPHLLLTDRYEDILDDSQIEAIVVVTPAPTHFSFAKRAMEAGKHVFVEKPLVLKVDEAKELVRVSRIVDRRLMVGHLLLYHPAVRKLKELIKQDKLGNIYYVYTQRLNLGRIRNTENVLWSLAPHDISVVLHLIESEPVEVTAKGSAFIQKGIEDVVFVNLKFKNGELGQIHVSWLDPTKTRRTIIVGSKKMAIFDEISSRNTLTLIDKGVDINLQFKTFDEFLKLRFGKEEIIEIEKEEPLKLECRHFVDCVKNDHEPLSSGENGLAVLRVLEAAQRSLDNGGSNELL